MRIKIGEDEKKTERPPSLLASTRLSDEETSSDAAGPPTTEPTTAGREYRIRGHDLAVALLMQPAPQAIHARVGGLKDSRGRKGASFGGRHWAPSIHRSTLSSQLVRGQRRGRSRAAAAVLTLDHPAGTCLLTAAGSWPPHDGYRARRLGALGRPRWRASCERIRIFSFRPQTWIVQARQSGWSKPVAPPH